jgi:hypothetical protein
MADSLQLEIKLPPVESLPSPEAANYFRFDRVGQDVQMTVGYVDLLSTVQEIGRARAGEKVRPLPVAVTHRLVLGLNAFLHLKQQLDEIHASFVKDEVVPAR